MTLYAFVTYLLIAVASLAVGALAVYAARFVGRRHGYGMVAFLALGVLFGHFLTGAEKAARQGVIFFHTDHDFLYLLDRGSVVLPDEVSISMTVRGLPDDAHIQLWRTPKCETNWVMHVDETLADWKQYYYNPDLHLYSRSFDYYEASSNLWCIFTTYIRPTQVLTNGVLHVVGVQCDDSTNAVAGVPLHTGVDIDGVKIDLGTKLTTKTMEANDE